MIVVVFYHFGDLYLFTFAFPFGRHHRGTVLRVVCCVACWAPLSVSPSPSPSPSGSPCSMIHPSINPRQPLIDSIIDRQPIEPQKPSAASSPFQQLPPLPLRRDISHNLSASRSFSIHDTNKTYHHHTTPPPASRLTVPCFDRKSLRPSFYESSSTPYSRYIPSPLPPP